LLLAFFVGFNILEASLPSLVSRLAPADAKGAALGIYNTTQALGLFFGGLLGGWVQDVRGRAAVFGVCAGLMALWLLVAAGQRRAVCSSGDCGAAVPRASGAGRRSSGSAGVRWRCGCWWRPGSGAGRRRRAAARRTGGTNGSIDNPREGSMASVNKVILIGN